MPAQFLIRAAAPEAVASVQSSTGLPRFVAQTLVARGIDNVELAQAFLDPSLERDWRDPYEIPGLSEVADALQEAMASGKRILVYGDFDLDGVSATTVLTRGLRALGAHATPFIPRRFEEGYGITDASIDRMKTYHPNFVVTVDCGIACKYEVQKLLGQGIQVAVTDHHEAADLVPEGVPVADPKLGKGCKSDILAGVGVALKLVQVLGARMGFPHLWRSYTDLATLGTVADLMPMRDENRALVAEGLARINTNPRPCVAALLGTAGLADTELTATNLSFTLIPRLNAAGRMGDAELALDLLMSDNYADACTLAAQLETINDQRRSIEVELSEQALAQAADNYHGERALVVAGRGWHEGVKGIVASRLVNRYGVPAILFTIVGDEARGSGRSVGSVNLFAAVESTADLLTRFGGHEAAVGVTLPATNLDEFRRRICSYMEGLSEDEFHARIEIDSCVDLDELTLENVGKLDQLAPFGQENNVPVYMARHITLDHCRAVGADKNHFSCVLSNGRSNVSAIMFHCNEIESLMANDAVVDAAFTLQIDEWRGRRSVKAMLESLVPARTCCALEACLDPQVMAFFQDLYHKREDADVVRVPRDESPAEEAERNRAYWRSVAAESPDTLEQALIESFIGQHVMHESQREILDKLREGISTLGIMATGRGKSLTFQVYAAWRALVTHEASLLVYPLRALVADQVYHISEALAPFGLSISVLTGESSPEERDHIFAGLNDGSQDFILTTPEFLVHHVRKFAASERIGFVVVDEAHHIGFAKPGQREAYTQLGRAIAILGSPVVLALTATANDAIAGDIDKVLSLEGKVIDPTERPNLEIDDQRNIKNRDDYLANLIAGGEKTVIYVNSREQTIALARLLRMKVPHIASLIGFYHGGLTRQERKRIETLFRQDAMNVLVATSAFGEGVNIPNIRHVVLYHLPFNEVEFNQMSGRAGRDGKPATVHLLYGRNDVALNERILTELTPTHDMMAQVYRRLRTIQRQTPGNFFALEDEGIAKAASDANHVISATSASCGVTVFRELGLIETKVSFESGHPVQWIRVNEQASRVELTDSVRYREGLGDWDIFKAFRDWAMQSDSQSLRIRVSHPIIPRLWRRDSE